MKLNSFWKIQDMSQFILIKDYFDFNMCNKSNISI